MGDLEGSGWCSSDPVIRPAAGYVARFDFRAALTFAHDENGPGCYKVGHGARKDWLASG